MIAGIIGAAGYGGVELIRLLLAHPHIAGLVLASVSSPGEDIAAIYPNFLGAGPDDAGNAAANPALAKFGKTGRTLVSPEDLIPRSDIVFGALPAGAGEGYAKACLDRGISYIDLSADFRFDDDQDTYQAWYGKPFVHPELRKRAVYGLPELNRSRIKELAASGPLIIGNPGCYPTGASLGAFPALAKNLVADSAVIIVDSASGTTGGGREPSRSFHYAECADSIAPYKVAAHRHSPEIARNLSAMPAGTAAGNAAAAGNADRAKAHTVIFTPHLAPMNRGILSTIYIPLAAKWQVKNTAGQGIVRPLSKEMEEKAAEIRKVYADFYRGEPFVRVLPAGTIAATNRVRQSNFCDISVHLDQSGTTLIIVSAIDNMVKGAAGQAVQNMNIICGFDEIAGLSAVPALF